MARAQEMRFCAHWTARREKKNSLKSRARAQRVNGLRLCVSERERGRKEKRERAEKCQSYDKEFALAGKERGVMDIWTNAFVVVIGIVELCHFGRYV